jgi:hypothetical protein
MGIAAGGRAGAGRGREVGTDRKIMHLILGDCRCLQGQCQLTLFRTERDAADGKRRSELT